MLSKNVGIVSIGQTPRPDIQSLFNEILGEGYDLSLKGALNDIIFEDVPKFRDDEYLLMTGVKDRLGKRRGTRVTREFLVPFIQKRIKDLEKENVGFIIIWCGGRFPEFESTSMVIRPSEIAKGTIESLLKQGKLGVIYPAKEQLIWAEPEWGRKGIEVYADSPGSSRNREEEIKLLAKRLANKKLDLILLNCAGFGYNMKKIIQEITQKPVIQLNTLTLRIVKELIL